MNQPANTIQEDGPVTYVWIHKVNGKSVCVVMDTADVRSLTGKLMHAQGGPGGHTTYAEVWDRTLKKRVLLHRWLLGVPDDIEVDHIDRNGLNNRRENLRRATRAKNAAAIPPQPNKTGYIGVREDQRGCRPRFDALIQRRLIGRFDTAREAAQARDSAAIEAYGEFAILNFPEQP